jgi:hypothetical protein
MTPAALRGAGAPRPTSPYAVVIRAATRDVGAGVSTRWVEAGLRAHFDGSLGDVPLHAFVAAARGIARCIVDGSLSPAHLDALADTYGL